MQLDSNQTVSGKPGRFTDVCFSLNLVGLSVRSSFVQDKSIWIPQPKPW